MFQIGPGMFFWPSCALRQLLALETALGLCVSREGGTGSRSEGEGLSVWLGSLPASWPRGLLFPLPRLRVPAGSRAAFPTVIRRGSGFNGFSTFLKGKTLAYCIPVVQSLQAMKTKIQVSIKRVSPLLLVSRKKPSAGSTAVIPGPADPAFTPHRFLSS